MSKYKYGIKNFIVASINPVDGTPVLDGSEIDIVDDIFRDSFDMTEEDGTETDLYAEMNNTPKVSFREPGKETLSLQYMDTTPDRLAVFLGGAVVTAGGFKTWSKPANQGINEKHCRIVLLDDTEMIVHRGKIVGKKNFQFRRNNIWTLDVSITPLDPGFGLNPIDIKEPSA